jgi:hypothetical protein
MRCQSSGTQGRPPFLFPGSLQISPDQANQIFCQFLRRFLSAVGMNDMQSDVIFQDLGHQAVDSTSDGGQEHQDIRTFIAVRDRALDRTHLPRQSSYAGEQFLRLSSRLRILLFHTIFIFSDDFPLTIP